MTAVRVTSLTESPAIPIEMTAATPATPATSISHWRLEQGFNWAIFAVVVVVVVVVVAVAAVASFHFHLTRWCPLARLNRWLKAPGARLLFRRRRIVNMAIMAPIIQTGIWGGREGGGGMKWIDVCAEQQPEQLIGVDGSSITVPSTAAAINDYWHSTSQSISWSTGRVSTAPSCPLWWFFERFLCSVSLVSPALNDGPSLIHGWLE